MKVSYFLRDNGGCAYYRTFLPLETMAIKNGTIVNSFERGDKADKIARALDADVFVLPRVCETDFINLIPQFREGGCRIVIDHDDNMFEVSPFSPHYDEVGTEEIWVSVHGKRMPMWVSDLNKDQYKHLQIKPNYIDIERNKKRKDNFIIAMQEADLVTVTQPILADVYRPWSKKIAVLPNCVDMTLWKKLPFLPRENIRLYWSGGSSHYEDWCMIAEVIPAIMKKYPNVTLVLFGTKFDGTLKQVPKERIEFHDWLATPAYPYKSAILDPDICVIPLYENEFSKCKSPIKWIEMGALGVPCVTSHYSPYKELATEANGIFIEKNDKNAWIEGLSMLIEDKELRLKIGQEANNTVAKHYDINKEWIQWYNAYEELLK